jgi:hypothetical protein
LAVTDVAKSGSLLISVFILTGYPTSVIAAFGLMKLDLLLVQSTATRARLAHYPGLTFSRRPHAGHSPVMDSNSA